jgi:hypothetical protein
MDCLFKGPLHQRHLTKLATLSRANREVVGLYLAQDDPKKRSVEGVSLKTRTVLDGIKEFRRGESPRIMRKT